MGMGASWNSATRNIGHEGGPTTTAPFSLPRVRCFPPQKRSCLFASLSSPPFWQMSRFAHRSSFLIAQALPSPHFVWANLRHYDCDCVPRTRKRVSVLLRLCLSRSRSATNLPTGRGTLIGSNPGPCRPFRAHNQDRRCKIQFPLSGRERGRKGIEPPDETPHQIR